MLGETAARRAIHSALSRPGLGCGSSVVSRKTNSHMASRYCKRRVVAQMAQGVAHFREEQFRLVAQTEERLGTSHLFAGSGHFQNLVRGHGMCAGLARITTENAVAAIIPAEVGQGDEDFA